MKKVTLSKRQKFLFATLFLFAGIILIRMGLGEFLSWRIRVGVFSIVIFLITFPLALASMWSVNLESKIGEQVRNFSLLIALILAQVAWVMSFWPVGVSIFALFLAAMFYELVGIVQYHL